MATDSQPARGPGHPRLSEDEDTVLLRVLVPDSLRARIRAQAAADGTTSSGIVREALERYLVRR